MKKSAVTPVLLEKTILKNLKGPSDQRDFVARYVGGVGHEDRKPDEISKLEFWGHQLPFQRAVGARLAKIILELTPQQQWDVWQGLWKKTRNYDVRSIAIIWMSQKKNRELRLKNWKDLFSMAGDVDNWALSDGLSGMLAEVLEEDPNRFSQFRRWNKSDNPWKRRQSIVGVYFYARFRKNPYPPREALKMIENLLDDPHFYVQRGVGWSLREVDRLDSKLQRAFVKKHLHRISSVAWFATTELYAERDRKVLVGRRKELRSMAL